MATEGATRSSALATASFDGTAEGSHLSVTVQLSAPGRGMEAGYRQGFGAPDLGMQTPGKLARFTGAD